MRCIRNWAGSKRLRKADAVFRQSIQGWGRPIRVSVAVNVVRSESIDGDQENVGAGFAGTAVLAAHRVPDRQSPIMLRSGFTGSLARHKHKCLAFSTCSLN